VAGSRRLLVEVNELKELGLCLHVTRVSAAVVVLEYAVFCGLGKRATS
jgi:hypothetical protein